jgi:hypothetical protein
MRLFYFGVICVLVVACGGRANVQCEQDSNCDLSGGGRCIEASSGNHWCAYPDPTCPGGYRYSTQDIGDGLSGVCVADGSGTDAGVDGGTDATPIDGPPVVPGSWAKQVPGSGFESVDALAVASDGSIFIGGAFDGTLDLGGGPLTATGTQDIFVAKFTAAGQHVWSVRFGGNSNAGVTEIAVLSNGELAIAGNYRGSVTFGGTTLTASGNRDVFATRLSTSGVPIWAVSGGTTGDEVLHDLAVDNSDNIVLCGGINIGGGIPPTGSFFGVNITGSNDAWLVRMTGAGVATWGKDMAAGGLDDNCGVTMMSNGDVVFVGNYNGTVNAGGSTFTSVSNSLDMYIARLKGSDGSHIASASEGGAGNDEAFDVDASGTSIILTGRFSGSMSFGGSTLTSAGDDDVFVAKLDGSTFAHQFSARMGGTSSEVGLHISTRSDGQVSVAGTFAGTADFGGTQLTSNGDIDPFVVDLDGSNGAVNQVKSVGGPSRDEAHDVASTTDSLVFAGSFSNSITVLNQTFTSMSGLDGYVVRYKR